MNSSTQKICGGKRPPSVHCQCSHIEWREAHTFVPSHITITLHLKVPFSKYSENNFTPYRPNDYRATTDNIMAFRTMKRTQKLCVACYSMPINILKGFRFFPCVPSVCVRVPWHFYTTAKIGEERDDGKGQKDPQRPYLYGKQAQLECRKITLWLKIIWDTRSKNCISSKLTWWLMTE